MLKPKQTSKSVKLTKLGTVLAMLSVTILASCQTLQTLTPRSSIPTNSTNRPAACIEFKRIEYRQGKPGGATVADIEAQLKRDNPIARVRNFVGDTMPTRAQVIEHNAVWDCLCAPDDKKFCVEATQ